MFLQSSQEKNFNYSKFFIFFIWFLNRFFSGKLLLLRQVRPSWDLLVQIQQWKHQSTMWNLFKANNKVIRMTSLTSFRCFYSWLWTLFRSLFWCFHCWLWTSRYRPRHFHAFFSKYQNTGNWIMVSIYIRWFRTSSSCNYLDCLQSR